VAKQQMTESSASLHQAKGRTAGRWRSSAPWDLSYGILSVAILLLALALRLFLLDGQSLWYDEGVSAFMTPRTFAQIAEATAVDIHPPLYYWLLATWASVFGQGEVALRGLSVLFGVLTVWATYRLGLVVAGPAVGLVAALLLATASSWAALALLGALIDKAGDNAGSGRRRAALAVVYGLLAGALLYTHYYGSLVVVAQGLYALIVLTVTRCWRIVPGWALAGGIATLLFLPWLPVALRQTGYYPGLGSPQPAWRLALDAVNVLSIGIATTRFGFRAGLAPFLGLAALGLVRLWRRRGGGHWLLLLWLLLPIAGIIILSQTRPLYEPRFLILVLPAWTLLLAAGLVALGTGAARFMTGQTALPRTARQLLVVLVTVVVAGGLLIPTARSLASYYYDPVYARDNYRGLAETVILREQPGDAVVLTAPGQVEIFSYYYRERGRSELYPLPRQRPIDVADTRARLEQLAEAHDRVWLVRWAANEADPSDLILSWLEGRGRRLGSQSFGRVELRLYDLGGIARLPTSYSRRERELPAR
jgi:mannosyltransferase